MCNYIFCSLCTLSTVSAQTDRLWGPCAEQRLEDKQHDMKTYAHNSCHRACWHRATRLPPARACVSTFLCSDIIYLLLYSHRHVAPLIREYGRGCRVRGATIGGEQQLNIIWGVSRGLAVMEAFPMSGRREGFTKGAAVGNCMKD